MSAKATGPALVVVLRFADGLAIDLVSGMADKAAIADFAGRSLANGATLPLIEALTSPVPAAVLKRLAGAAIEPPDKPPEPPIPVRGLVHAISAYLVATATQKPAADIHPAREALSAFFAHYGVTLDFTGEREP